MRQLITLEVELKECLNCPGITHEILESDMRSALASLLNYGEEIIMYISDISESVN